MIADKARLRSAALHHRDRLHPDFVEETGAALATCLSALPLWREAKFPALYVSTRGEVSTRRLLEELFHRGRAVALPRVEGAVLRLHRVTSFTDLVPGKFGIPEPSPATPCVAPTDPDLIVVPGVVFDRRGHRVGYGKGYYDRLLADTPAPALALAYGFQLVPRVPDEPHDRRMDYILTPDEFIPCGDRA